MKAKLIKVKDYYYLQELSAEHIVGSQCERTLGDTDGNGEYGKLSKQNCDAIFGVVDVWSAGLEIELDKLPYTKHLDDGQYNDGQVAGFELGAEWGYNKAMELNKDKLFTEEQMFRMFLFGHSLSEAIKRGVIEDKPMGEIFNDRIQFLQQPSEIEVEIEMEDSLLAKPRQITGSFTAFKSLERVVFPTPKLDSNGCLILKRVTGAAN
jgi:hypothetical protein